jgi:hypothetical protein
VQPHVVSFATLSCLPPIINILGITLVLCTNPQVFHNTGIPVYQRNARETGIIGIVGPPPQSDSLTRIRAKLTISDKSLAHAQGVSTADSEIRRGEQWETMIQ